MHGFGMEVGTCGDQRGDFMKMKTITEQIANLNFLDAYNELCQNNYCFSFDNLTKDFPRLNSQQMYLFLMYAISQDEDVEKHLAICYYLYFMDPYIVGADSLIRWHLMQALRVSPCNVRVLKDWIFGIYDGNPDSPFSESELLAYKKILSTIPISSD